MGKKLTNEEFLRKLKNLGRDDIEPLEEYKGSGKKILCRCKKHNYEWKVTPDDLYAGSGCPKCKIEKIGNAKRKTHEQFLKDMEERGNPEVEIVGQYSKDCDLIKCKCKSCGHEWENTPSNLLRGEGCPYCANKKASKENCFATHYPELVKYLKNKEDAYTHTYGSGDIVWVICPDCDTERLVRLHDLAKHGFKCQVCGDNISYPNKFLRWFLLDDTINGQIEGLQFEWNPHWDKRVLFDASFILNNDRFVVEMQGIQHYNLKWHNREDKTILERDNYKVSKCKENNIKEIIIDCRDSNFEFIKNNISNSVLGEILDISQVNWAKIALNIERNLVKECCELYNKNPFWSTLDIANQVKIEKVTVIRYLKRGTEIGWCNYTTNEEENRRHIKVSKWIYELYEGSNKITETFGRRKMEQYLKDNYPSRTISQSTIDVISQTDKEVNGFTIKRIENPYKASKMKESIKNKGN